jgi:hypothetical protein
MVRAMYMPMILNSLFGKHHHKKMRNSLAILIAAIVLLASCSEQAGKLRAPVKLNGKYGYIDENGTMVIEAKYEDAMAFIRGSAVVSIKDKYGLIDKNGNEITPFQYDSIIPFSAACCIVQQNNKFGFIANGTGKVLVDPNYDRVYYYTDELCVVEKGQGLGIVNSEGKLMCEPVLQDLQEFNGPCAIVTQYDTTDQLNYLMSIVSGSGSGKAGLINRSGKIIIQPQYDEIFDDAAHGYYFPLIRDKNINADTLPENSPLFYQGLYGITDTTGKIIAVPQFDEQPVWGENFFRVRVNNKYGFADKSGKIVIPAQWEYATAFNEGKAIVSDNGKTGIINTNGEIVQSNLGEGAGLYQFHAGLARCRSNSGLYGFLNDKGERVIPVKFDAADDFDPEIRMAIVSENGNYGVINTAGQFVIPANFEFIYYLGRGFYQVALADGQVGVIRKDGKKILTESFDEIFYLQPDFFTVEKDLLTGCFDTTGREIFPVQSATPLYFMKGRTEVSKDDKYGVINEQGKLIIPILYDSIGIYFRGYSTVFKNSKFGMVDSLGKEIIAPSYDDLHPMINGYAAFRKGKLYGYLNAEGNIAIEPQFEEAAALIDPDRKEFEE